MTSDFVGSNYVRMLQGIGFENPDPFAKCHCPRIIGATTMAAAGYVTEAMLKSQGRWGSDIAFIYSRQSREAMRRMQIALWVVDAESLVAELARSAPAHATVEPDRSDLLSDEDDQPEVGSAT